MSRIHLIFGIVFIIVLAISGMATTLVTIGEGLIILLITLVSAPLLFNLLKKTPRHDDR